MAAHGACAGAAVGVGMTNKYQELDAAICDYVARRAGHPIYSSVLEGIARRLAAANRVPLQEPWRLIDRRMQSLRKAGRLAYERKTGGGSGVWRVVAPAREIEA